MRLLPIRKKRLLAGSLLLVSALGLLIYSAFVEPYRLVVTHHQVTASLRSPIKIAHLSDIHTYGMGRREHRMLAILEAENPDLIVITGDLISDARGYEGLLEVLKQMHAPLGIWVVRGNHENWFPVDELRKFGSFNEYFAAAGANYLFNSSRQARDDVWIVGLDDAMTGMPDIRKAIAGVPTETYKIALFHSPAYFDELKGSCNLVFAGHSHGGQIRLPFLKPTWLPVGCNDYVNGWYERDGAKMYVSRGIGTSIFPIRFNCPPEIAIITVG